MRKSFVFMLLALAVIVLVSPGIVGQLAEKSMDKNLDWAADEARDFEVTSSGFVRGWFSSEGQHRVEITDGALRDSLLAISGENGLDEIPALIIDTHIDHGIVPVTSVGREGGSLAPGLGSAVSTLGLEFSDGERVELPGTVYSKVGLTGQLRSNLVMGPGSFEVDGETAAWGDVDVVLVMSPSNNLAGFEGSVDRLSLLSSYSELTLDEVAFSGEQRRTRFDFAVGDAELSIGTVVFPAELGTTESGPLRISSAADLDDERVSGWTTIDIDRFPLGALGPTRIGFDASVANVDAESVGRISRTIDEIDDRGGSDDLMLAVTPDLEQLLSRGLEFNVGRLELASTNGTMSATLDVDIAPTDPDRFVMTSLLLATDARLDLIISEDLFDYLALTNPDVGTAATMGFLRKNGNVYEVEALFRDGRLTINGAPMPIPLQSGN